MKTKYLIQGAMIAAIYFVLTYAVAPISSGLLQCRVSEALSILPFFTPAAVPGLFVGCLVANLIMMFTVGLLPLDVIFGSLATLIAAYLSYVISRKVPIKAARWLAPAPAVVVNALVVGWLLSDVYQVGVSYLVCALYVAAGQILACYVLGMPLLFLLERYKEKLFS
ncbi:MAG TPA: QueT transporter family protein [Feifaniaceae bacterium]|nr:QueT transporter family protein [Feifaniaceae bacterium]